jgi:O-antigen/teichoic acid export membrane protein
MSVIKRQTILGTIYSYLGVAIGIISQAFLIPNYLTSAQNGLLAMLMSWMMIISIFCNLGFNSAGTRYFAQFRDPNKQHNGYLFNGFVFLFIGTIITTIALFVFKDKIISSKINDSNLFEQYYYFIIPITLSTAIFNIFDNYTKGLFETVMSNFLNQFLQRFLILLSIILYIIQFVNFSTFVLLWTFSIIFPTIILLVYSISLGSFSLKPSKFILKPEIKNKFIQFSFYSLISAMSSILITKLDSIMVHQYLGLSNTGIYSTCLLFGSVMTISYSVNMKASAAIVVSSLDDNDLPKINTLFAKSSITQSILGTLLLLIVWINVDHLFLLIKPEYTTGKYVILIIGLAKLFDLSSGINSLILAYSKYYKFDSALVISFVGLLFILNHFLIPQFGLNGAAFAAMIATVYYNAARNFLIWRFFKIHPYRLTLIYIFVTGLLLYFFGSLLPNIKGGLIALLFTIIYKSMFIGICFGFILYKLQVSPDLNSVLDKLCLVIKTKIIKK